MPADSSSSTHESGASLSIAFRVHTVAAWLKNHPAAMQKIVTPINSVRKLN